MDRSSVEWKGFIPAITTPFAADGSIDWDGWRDLIEFLVADGLHGITIGGTTGEWFSMTEDERRESFRFAAEVVDGRITVLGGCNSFTPVESIRHAQAAHDAGLDGILLTPPPYVVPTDRELLAFYRAVSDAVEIPICIYNWPRGIGREISVELAKRLVEVDNVVAIKNSSGDLRNFMEMFFAVGDQVRYFGVPITELGIMLLQSGADGQIGAGAVIGRDEARFFDAVWAGDLETARRCVEREARIWRDWINADYSPKFGSPQAIMKAALNLRGLPGGYLRPPLLPLAEDEVEIVRATLIDLGLVQVGA
jgi:dihydrodipicolinate synthase/N-acetylneuraminate lyase